MRNVLKQHVKKKKGAVAFSILCQIKLVKYNNEEEDLESTDVYYHCSTNRVIFNTEKLLTIDGIKKVYDKAMANMDEKLDKYIREQPEWVMEKISAIILNIPNSENMCSGNIWVCACVQCEEDRQSEGGDDNQKHESGEDQWSEYNVEVENRDVQSDINN